VPDFEFSTLEQNDPQAHSGMHTCISCSTGISSLRLSMCGAATARRGRGICHIFKSRNPQKSDPRHAVAVRLRRSAECAWGLAAAWLQRGSCMARGIHGVTSRHTKKSKSITSLLVRESAQLRVWAIVRNMFFQKVYQKTSFAEKFVPPHNKTVNVYCRGK